MEVEPQIAQVAQTIKTIDLAEDDAEDVDFVVPDEDLELADESSADESSDEEGENEGEKGSLEVVEEDFCVEIVNGEFKKLKFNQDQHMEGDSQEEADSQEEDNEGITLKSLEADLPDEDEEADPNFDPCAETLSDVEIDAEEVTQDDPMETENVEGVHKKTGEILRCIKINEDEMKVMTGEDNKEESEEMKE
ncbi:Oidioi.mRNA.OKI2018_I69.chr2.g6793.t1.cds [Oikopleura dioica]|uniref:Oidioi.mRNA.OKI2018_I69.chr2.g6793.t1.cds n=1 Tax=Oikopleura dioica TaxID=34765 RepID=A0ABN7TB65_OIKDI|nr:Oidioi.mRNA.OKI2018_I69.chr2.g6793.t1.cds [Oikopleura dioica]